MKIVAWKYLNSVETSYHFIKRGKPKCLKVGPFYTSKPMKKFILSLSLFITLAGYSTTVIIKNSGNAFTPANVTISFGDSVRFTIGSIHDAVEVSKQIWDANEASPLSGGFKLPMSGGLLIPEQLAIGTHYFVCTPHAGMGMKGSIVVLGPSSIPSHSPSALSFFPNPAHELISVKAGNELIGANYQIVDVTGKQVAAGKIENAEDHINITGLSMGIYFFRTTSQKEEMFRFIKN